MNNISARHEGKKEGQTQSFQEVAHRRSRVSSHEKMGSWRSPTVDPLSRQHFVEKQKHARREKTALFDYFGKSERPSIVRSETEGPVTNISSLFTKRREGGCHRRRFGPTFREEQQLRIQSSSLRTSSRTNKSTVALKGKGKTPHRAKGSQQAMPSIVTLSRRCQKGKEKRCCNYTGRTRKGEVWLAPTRVFAARKGEE